MKNYLSDESIARQLVLGVIATVVFGITGCGQGYQGPAIVSEPYRHPPGLEMSSGFIGRSVENFLPGESRRLGRWPFGNRAPVGSTVSATC